MPTIYDGNASNVVLGGDHLIQDSTDATPIVLHDIAHGYLSGDTVSVRNHQVNTNANGVWIVAVTDVDHYQLVGSVGTGAGPGGLTGRVVSLAVGGFQEIDDSPAPTATQLNTPPEANADQIAFLAKNLGAYKQKFIFESGADSASPGDLTAWAQFALATPNTWTLANLGAAVFVPGGMFINPNDYVEVEFEGSALFQGSTISPGLFVGTFGIWTRFAAPGAAFGPAVKLLYSDRVGSDRSTASTSNTYVPIHCKGTFFNIFATQLSQFEISIRAVSTDLTHFNAMLLVGAYRIAVRHYRPTGMVQ